MQGTIYINNYDEIPKNIILSEDRRENRESVTYEGKSYIYLGKALKGKKQYYVEKLKCVAQLVLKCALAVLILPLFFSTYRNSVLSTYQELSTSNREVPVYWSENIPAWQKINFMDQAEKRKFEKMKKDPLKFLIEETKRFKLMQGGVSRGDGISLDIYQLDSNYDSLFGKVRGVQQNYGSCDGLWMRGIAVAASHLIEKHQLPKDRMFVCQHLEAMKDKISEIASSSQEGRYALVVPHSGGLNNKFTPLDYPQHKVALCIEKTKDGILRIALLDAEPIEGNDSINPNHLPDPMDLKTHKQVNTPEAIFATILQANFGNCKLDFSFSRVIREKHYGCESFALEDCVNFLKRDSFFSDIHYDGGKVLHLSNKIDIKAINKLPTEFMAGTQSMQIIDQYCKTYAEEINLSFPLKPNKNLKQSLAKYRANQGDKSQNHRMTWKTYKNMRRVMNAMHFLSKNEIDQLIEKVLLKKK